MDKVILNNIKSNIKKLMKQNHFKVNGQSYIRIINKQIIQIINFQGSSSGQKFTVNIVVTPISSYELLCLPKQGLRVGSLFYGYDKWWDYTENSVLEVTLLIKDKVLSFLDEYSNYEKIYYKINSEINNIKREERNWNDVKTQIYYYFGNISLFWICLKNNDYEKCEQLLENEKNQELEWLDSNLKSLEKDINDTESLDYKKTFEDYAENYKRTVSDNLKKIESLKEILINKQIADLLKIANENEEKNLSKFKKYMF